VAFMNAEAKQIYNAYKYTNDLSILWISYICFI